jgi:hypothetical protein
MPLWSRDGKQLFFGETTLARDLSVVSITTRPSLTFGNPTHVPRVGLLAARGGPNSPRNWDIAADDAARSVLSMLTIRNRRFRIVLNWFTELQRRVPIK